MSYKFSLIDFHDKDGRRLVSAWQLAIEYWKKNQIPAERVKLRLQRIAAAFDQGEKHQTVRQLKDLDPDGSERFTHDLEGVQIIFVRERPQDLIITYLRVPD